VLAVALVMAFVLLPQQHLLAEGRDALCAGNLDFVYSKNGVGQYGWTETATSPPETAPARWPAHVMRASGISHAATPLLGALLGQTNCSYCYQGAAYTPGVTPSTTVPKQHTCCVTMQAHFPSIAAGRFSIVELGKETKTRATDVVNANCRDLLKPPAIRSDETSTLDDAGGTDAENIWRSIIGDHEPADGACGEGCPIEQPLCFHGECVVPECSHVLDLGLCDYDGEGGARARQFCSVTCGCSNPLSKLALTHDFNGCPASCTIPAGVATNEFTGQVEAIARNCSDLDHTSGPFREYILSVLALAERWPNTLQMLTRLVYGSLLRYGCNMVPFWQGHMYRQICAPTGAIMVKGVSYFCPASCSCVTPGKCPFQCLP